MGTNKIAALSGLASLLAVVTLIWAALNLNRLYQHSADAASGTTGVWLFNPISGPGDTLHFDVDTYVDKMKVALGTVKIRAADTTVVVHGDGRDWDESSGMPWGETNSSISVAVPIPPDHPEGTALSLDFEVDRLIAYRDDDDQPLVESQERIELTLQVPIKSASERRNQRIWLYLRSLLLLLGLYSLGRWIARVADSRDALQSENLGAFLLIALLGSMVVAHPCFARPLSAATGLVGDDYHALWVCIWAMCPLVGFFRGRGAQAWKAVFEQLMKHAG